jgi:hypothetical protein
MILSPSFMVIISSILKGTVKKSKKAENMLLRILQEAKKAIPPTPRILVNTNQIFESLTFHIKMRQIMTKVRVK